MQSSKMKHKQTKQLKINETNKLQAKTAALTNINNDLT